MPRLWNDRNDRMKIFRMSGLRLLGCVAQPPVDVKTSLLASHPQVSRYPMTKPFSWWWNWFTPTAVRSPCETAIPVIAQVKPEAQSMHIGTLKEMKAARERLEMPWHGCLVHALVVAFGSTGWWMLMVVSLDSERQLDNPWNILTVRWRFHRYGLEMGPHWLG